MELEDKLMDALVYGKSKQIEKVFEEVYYQYYKLVYYCIKQTVKLKEDIEELSNDVFVSFFNGLNRQTKIDNLKNYLCQIAKNKAVDFLRKNKIESLELVDNMILQTTNDENLDLLDIIRSKLNEEEYDILTKHLFLEKTFKEIALATNSSINTIKSTYRRSIKKLKGVEL